METITMNKDEHMFAFICKQDIFMEPLMVETKVVFFGLKLEEYFRAKNGYFREWWGKSYQVYEKP